MEKKATIRRKEESGLETRESRKTSAIKNQEKKKKG